jgi:two-component system, NarL family, invasion response regulator UvrY
VIRVLVADDHPVVLEGLHRLLSKQADVALVGEARDGDALIELATTTLADVVLLDISMPGPGFAEIIRRLHKERPRLAILVLSGQPESQYAVRVLRAGASGFLGKESLSDELANAIRVTASGRRYIPPGVAETLLDAVNGAASRPPHESLSDREFEVLKGTAQGKPVKQIAQELGLSPKTVSTYRRRVLDKLKVDSQAEAIRYAVSHGIIVDIGDAARKAVPTSDG